MSRIAVLAIAVLCYFAFFASFLYLVGFLSGLPFMPSHVDKGISAPTGIAVAVDLALIALFGLQHSVMARPGFKRVWTRTVAPALERSIYCLATATVLALMFAFWHELTQPIWHVANEAGRAILWTVFALGIVIVFISTWLISHFELFGLAQAWSRFRDRPMPEQQFRTPLLYRVVRHPIYLGFFLALWATPDMSLGHLILAAGLTVYMVIGATLEERDLVSHFGPVYVEYQSKVSMIIPVPGRK